MKRIAHYGYPAACGAWSEDSTGPGREQVTCKRCLTSLAKRDREFQKKARRQFSAKNRERQINAYLDSVGIPRWKGVSGDVPWARKGDAARAIAREEGRT